MQIIASKEHFGVFDEYMFIHEGIWKYLKYLIFFLQMKYWEF